MKVGIIGTGAYGLSLGLVLVENHCSVTMWTKFKEEKKELEKLRNDDNKLPNILIPEEIVFTTKIKEVVEDKDLIIIAVPAAFVDDVSEQIVKYISEEQVLCIASKGIENNTCAFLTDVVTKYIKTNHLAVISGPSFAIDIASKVPIGLSLGTKSIKANKVIKEALENNHLRLRDTEDMIGIEICGAIKNVIAIASGILDGMGLPESTQAMFITESLHDIKELINGLGGDKNTILSYAGFGDLLLTCTSIKSRNFCFGKLIGEKKTQAEIDYYLKKHTVEGLYTLKSIYQLVCEKKLNIPIIDLIYKIVFYHENCDALLQLLITKN